MPKKNDKGESGFSLIEVMISAAIMTVGLLSLLGVFGLAMASTQQAQQDMIAKQIGNEAMEGLITARDTQQIPFDSIQNVSNGGIFLDNFQPILQPGVDGILGTGDDAGGAVLTEPGPDGIMGTADDVQLPLTDYQRQIQIAAVPLAGGGVSQTLRSVTITIQYNVPQRRAVKQFVLTGFISKYR